MLDPVLQLDPVAELARERDRIERTLRAELPDLPRDRWAPRVAEIAWQWWQQATTLTGGLESRPGGRLINRTASVGLHGQQHVHPAIGLLSWMLWTVLLELDTAGTLVEEQP